MIESFTWKFDQDWSACNKSCGKGYRIKHLSCINIENEVVNDSLCDINKKPEFITEACNTNISCISELVFYLDLISFLIDLVNIYTIIIHFYSRWFAGEWQICKGNCIKDGIGYRKRSVICVKKIYNQFNDEIDLVARPEIECSYQKKPAIIEECKAKCNMIDEHVIKAHWHFGEWKNVLIFFLIYFKFNLKNSYLIKN
jgi:hypothetical protein